MIPTGSFSTERRTELTDVKGFVDYTKFRGDAKKRARATQDFVDETSYELAYDQPGLDKLYDLLEPVRSDIDTRFIPLSDIEAQKRSLMHTALELEAVRSTDLLSEPEYDLYISFAEQQLKKIMLVEAARRMRKAGSSAEQQVAREEFTYLNHELYGDINQETFDAMISTEHTRLDALTGDDELTQNIRSYLERSYRSMPTDAVEKPLMTSEALEHVQEFVLNRYDKVLSVVPDTDNTVIYDGQEASVIISDALVASGLSSEGWTCEVTPGQSIPSTNGEKRVVYIPESTRRTADQLRRLIVHEVEVHARRGTNGAKTGYKPLKAGTANYADVEEGLGVMLECAVAGSLDNQSFDRARDRYIVAGLALGSDGRPRDARGTYEVTWRMLAARNAKEGSISEEAVEKAKTMAMTHIENAFRGTPTEAHGLIYRKLKVYWEGLEKNAQLFTDNIDNLDELFDRMMIGKYDHTDEDETALVLELTQS